MAQRRPVVLSACVSITALSTLKRLSQQWMIWSVLTHGIMFFLKCHYMCPPRRMTPFPKLVYIYTSPLQRFSPHQCDHFWTLTRPQIFHKTKVSAVEECVGVGGSAWGGCFDPHPLSSPPPRLTALCLSLLAASVDLMSVPSVNTMWIYYWTDSTDCFRGTKFILCLVFFSSPEYLVTLWK